LYHDDTYESMRIQDKHQDKTPLHELLVTGVVNGCRWCRAKTFFSHNEMLLEPRELGYTLYTLVRLWSALVARSRMALGSY
jgi:hypothetical protein